MYSQGPMQMKLVTVIVLVSLVCLFLYLSRKTRSKPKEFKTTDEFVQWLAQEAVRDAAGESHVTLDYSPESIKSVDQILGKLHEQYEKALSTVAVRGLAAAYGAYIGEVIRRSEPSVHWARDDQLGEKIYPLIWNTGSVYPMAWCQKQIENGQEDSVWMKYRVFKEMESKASK